MIWMRLFGLRSATYDAHVAMVTGGRGSSRWHNSVHDDLVDIGDTDTVSHMANEDDEAKWRAEFERDGEWAVRSSILRVPAVLDDPKREFAVARKGKGGRGALS